MAHEHSHNNSNLKLAFWLNLCFTILEIIGGFLVNSVAVLSDALHDLGDSIALGVAWYLDRKSRKKATEKFTFGYARFSLLGALFNSLVLIGGSVYVVTEAIRRMLEPETSNATGMIIFAFIGIAVNGYAAWKVSKGKSLNERVVSWHLLEDVLGWVAVLIAAFILLFTDNPYIDPAVSVLITLYVLWNVLKRLKETLHVFLQGKPADLDLEEIRTELLQVPNVRSLHHTHLWSLDGQHHVFTTHLILDHISSFREIIQTKQQIRDSLKQYDLSHYTIEVELNEETCEMR